MTVGAIARFVLPAALTGLAAGGACLLIRRKKCLWRELLTVVYLAALIEIIALRFGQPRARSAPELIPFATLLSTAGGGAWSFLYHTLGNIAWFVPLGLLTKPRSLLRAALYGAALSLLLETLQWMLGTGVPDVDDVLLNALGAMAGALPLRLPAKRSAKERNAE